MSSRAPLRGLRVLDASHVWAGPQVGRILALLGAEVIKVESLHHLDELRGRRSQSYEMSAGEHWNKRAPFNVVNVNKLSLAVNLRHPRGVELVKRLAAVSDVFIENYRVGTMDKLGLGPSQLAELNPGLIYVTMPAFGLDGPWRDYIGYGINQEHLSGQGWLTGYEGEGPMKSGVNHCDPLTANHAVAGVILALLMRRRTGTGLLVEVSQLESSVSLVGPYLLYSQLSGEEAGRTGNRHPWAAPHGVYRCQGTDEWVALAVFNDDEFARLCAVMGRPELAQDERFATLLARKRNERQLDEIIGAWTVGLSKREVTARLQAAGIAAAPVMTARDLLDDPHLTARGFFKRVYREDLGYMRVPGLPLRFRRLEEAPAVAAPKLGEHNEHVLRCLLGLTEQEITPLHEEQVVGTEPLNPS